MTKKEQIKQARILVNRRAYSIRHASDYVIDAVEELIKTKKDYKKEIIAHKKELAGVFKGLTLFKLMLRFRMEIKPRRIRRIEDLREDIAYAKKSIKKFEEAYDSLNKLESSK